MHNSRYAVALILAGLVGCTNAPPSRFATAPKINTLTSIGDESLPAVSGLPGRSVAADVSTDDIAPPNDPRLAGRVVDAQGRPLAGASVRIAVNGRKSGRSTGTTTDGAGRFTLHGLRAGSDYTVIAELENAAGTVLTGRVQVQAPATNVQIAVAPPTTGARRLAPAADRREVADPPAEEDPAAERVNREDLPPVEGADEFETADRLATNPDSGPGVPWRKGDAAGEPASTAGGATDSPPHTSDAELDDDGPNPLPPARERPEPSSAPAPQPSPRQEQAEIFDPAPARPPTDATPAAQPLTDPPPANDTPQSLPAAAEAPASQPATPAGAAESTAPPAETPDATPAPTEPAPNANDQASTRRRPTWGEVIRARHTALVSDPGGSAGTRPATSRSAPSQAARDPRPISCQFDAKTARLVDFALPDLQGRTVHFRDLDSDFVLIDFWGSWCGPCVGAIPHLVELQKQYGADRLKVVGIAYEDAPPRQAAVAAGSTARRLGVNYAVLLGGTDGAPCPVQAAFGVRAFPTMVLLDRHGRVLWRDTGATSLTLGRLDRVLASRLDPEVVRR
jgi:thiol-disulfide isomerase/thioredoxin